MKDNIFCHNCKTFIGDRNEENLEKFQSSNHGIGGKSEHECSHCRKIRNAAYDDYVDPLRAYH